MRSLASWIRRLSRPTRPIRTRPPRVSRPPFVEALEDRLLPTAYVVTTTKDILGDTTPGEVTLRDALTALDGTPSGNATAVGTAANTITFAIPGAGPRTIHVGGSPSAPGQPLPAITRPVFLDGWSQGGPGYHGPPLIVLNGAQAGSAASGIVLGAGSNGSTIRGLVIQQFAVDGIDVNGTRGNLIAGNYLGTDAGGTAPLGNSGDGVLIHGGAIANTVGGTAAGGRNVLSGNSIGVEIADRGTSGNLILGNLIGTDRTGTAPVGNSQFGVRIADASANTVGGLVAAAANIISGNDLSEDTCGMQIVGAGATGNLVVGNRVGTDVTGTASLHNAFNGIGIAAGATANTIGGTAPGAGNLISGNGFGPGVELSNPTTSGNVVLGNLIGTDITGTRALGNDTGVALDDGAPGNTIGGTMPGSANVISGNGRGGVDFSYGASGSVVLGNLIGTDPTGTQALGNGGAGVGIDSGTGNTIGGTTAGAGNVISANAAGISMSGTDTTGNVVLGNLIGTDKSGARALGNGTGLYLFSESFGNTIGGTDPGAGNVISGNNGGGIAIGGYAHNYVVLGNRIGTDVTGTKALGNGGDGVSLGIASWSDVVGGAAPGAGNVISANGGRGVAISGINSTDNVVAGNRIGTDVTGTKALGNAGAGVSLDNYPQRTVIGGTADGSGNMIAFNAKGVVVADDATTGDSVLGNSVFGNAGPGIDLGDDGPTPNGANPRPFPNDGQNAPALTGVSDAQVSGTLSSVPNTDFRLEFFAGLPAAGPAQGRTFLGSFDVTTDAAGDAAFAAPVATLKPGTVVTATATDLATGDTSEFSAGAPFAPTVYVVTTTKDILGDTTPGELTLRDALTALDGTSSGNATAVDSAYTIITFAIPGTGPQEIDVGSDPSALNQPLPAITRPVLLDGWSQGGAGYQGPPLIVLNGAGAGGGAEGLVLNAGSDGSMVRGLVIQQFASAGIDVNGTSGNVIEGDYIGTDAGGAAARGNGDAGVLIRGGGRGQPGRRSDGGRPQRHLRER